MNIKGWFKKLAILGVIFASIGGLYLYTIGMSSSDVAQQLFRKVEQKGGKNLTQTEALMSLPKNQVKIAQLHNLSKYEPIIQAALAKEQEYRSCCYVFYSSVPLRLFQDVARKLYKRSGLALGAFKDKSFQLIRFTLKDPFYSQYKDVTDFLLQETQKNGVVDDNDNRLKTILVSTNVALFGNADFPGESTWHYFNNPQGWAQAKREWLENSLSSFGYPTTYVDELLNLLPDLRGTSELFQFIIPKELVNKIGYLSWRQGVPFDPHFIDAVLGGVNLTESSQESRGFGGTNSLIYKFKDRYKAKDPEAIKLADYMLAQIKNGKFYLFPRLSDYRNNPASLPGMMYYQARLLVHMDTLLNPNSGIKIYRYSTLSPEREKVYRSKLSEIMKKMDKEKGRIK
jgi:hypothetical protein